MNQLDSYPHNPNQLEKNNHKNVIFRHSALLDILFQERGQNSKIIQHGGIERGGKNCHFCCLQMTFLTLFLAWKFDTTKQRKMGFQIQKFQY